MLCYGIECGVIIHTIQAVETLLNDIEKDVDVSVKAGVALRNDLLQVQLRQNDVASQRLKLVNGISLVRMLLSQYCGMRDTVFSITYNAGGPTPLPAGLRQAHRCLCRIPEPLARISSRHRTITHYHRLLAKNCFSSPLFVSL